MSIIPQSNFAPENTKIFVGYYDDDDGIPYIK